MCKRHIHCWRSAIVLCLFAAVAVVVKATPAVAAETMQGKNDLGTAAGQTAELKVPGVVHVEAIRQAEVTNQGAGLAGSSFIKQFFDLANTPPKVRQELRMLGTGMIIDSGGHVLTIQNVVAGATQIYVLLADGRQYPAKLVGADPKTDMAVVLILTKDSLPHVTFGNSDTVQVGESVAAVAHLRPQDPSVSHGTILGKHGPGATTPISYNDYFEKEPVVNLGYSGGPLLNLRGEVIAVNIAILSGFDDLRGIAFSIPSNVALNAARQLIAGREVNAGLSEGRAECLSVSLARTVSMKDPSTISVGYPMNLRQADRPAVKSELVTAGSDTHYMPGAIATDKRMRVNGKYVRESDRLLMAGKPQIPVNTQGVWIKRCLGVATRPCTREEARKYHISGGNTVVISSLEPACPLARTGVEVNDMILEINGHRISGFDHFMYLLTRTKPRQRITILVLDHRTGRAGYVQVRAQ